MSLSCQSWLFCGLACEDPEPVGGVAVTGLHWLLLKPAGLSIRARDEQTRKKTIEVMLALIDQCAELGGRDHAHQRPAQVDGGGAGGARWPFS